MDDVIRDRDEVVEPAELLSRVSYRIRLIQIAAYKSFEKVVTGLGTAPRYYGLLKIVEANPGIPQTRLAEAIFLDRSSLVPILETLTDEGWVERRATERDRRVRRVYLTAQGQERLSLLEREVARHEEMMTGGMSEAEKARLLASFDRIDANLREAFAAPEMRKAP
jgi:DNA-binding MarR family transcriptional regulator